MGLPARNAPDAATVAPIRTRAMDAFLARPLVLHGTPARAIRAALAGEREEIVRPRRERIERGLERLCLRIERLCVRMEPLLAELDALDGDWDLEAEPDHEPEPGEPNLSATNLIDQRCWSAGGATELEADHDGREPDCDAEGYGWPSEGDQSAPSFRGGT